MLLHRHGEARLPGAGQERLPGRGQGEPQLQFRRCPRPEGKGLRPPLLLQGPRAHGRPLLRIDRGDLHGGVPLGARQQEADVPLQPPRVEVGDPRGQSRGIEPQGQPGSESFAARSPLLEGEPGREPALGIRPRRPGGVVGDVAGVAHAPLLLLDHGHRMGKRGRRLRKFQVAHLEADRLDVVLLRDAEGDGDGPGDRLIDPDVGTRHVHDVEPVREPPAAVAPAALQCPPRGIGHRHSHGGPAVAEEGEEILHRRCGSLRFPPQVRADVAHPLIPGDVQEEGRRRQVLRPLLPEAGEGVRLPGTHVDDRNPEGDQRERPRRRIHGEPVDGDAPPAAVHGSVVGPRVQDPAAGEPHLRHGGPAADQRVGVEPLHRRLGGEREPARRGGVVVPPRRAHAELEPPVRRADDGPGPGLPGGGDGGVGEEGRSGVRRAGEEEECREEKREARECRNAHLPSSPFTNRSTPPSIASLPTASLPSFNSRSSSAIRKILSASARGTRTASVGASICVPERKVSG